MSDIRIFKCQQCQHEQALDTVFNFEVCPRCGGNFFPVDQKPPVDWKLRAEKAEADLEGAKSANIALRTELENVKRQWGECANRNVAYAGALRSIAILSYEHGACDRQTLETIIDEMKDIAKGVLKK